MIPPPHEHSTQDRSPSPGALPRTPEQWAQRIVSQCEAISARIDFINAGLRADLEPFRCDKCGRMRPCGCERAA